MISELLSIQTDIDNIERILIVEIWNIREFTNNFLLFISALNTYPVL